MNGNAHAPDPAVAKNLRDAAVRFRKAQALLDNDDGGGLLDTGEEVTEHLRMGTTYLVGAVHLLATQQGLE